MSRGPLSGICCCCCSHLYLSTQYLQHILTANPALVLSFHDSQDILGLLHTEEGKITHCNQCSQRFLNMLNICNIACKPFQIHLASLCFLRPLELYGQQFCRVGLFYLLAIQSTRRTVSSLKQPNIYKQ